MMSERKENKERQTRAQWNWLVLETNLDDRTQAMIPETPLNGGQRRAEQMIDVLIEFQPVMKGDLEGKRQQRESRA